MLKKRENWEKLFNLLDDNEFDCEDMLFCICSTLSRMKGLIFTHKMSLDGIDYKIRIEKEI